MSRSLRPGQHREPAEKQPCSGCTQSRRGRERGEPRAGEQALPILRSVHRLGRDGADILLSFLTFYFVLGYSRWGMSFPGGSDGKEFACNAGDLGLIPGMGRSPGEGNANPLQYSCLENLQAQRSLAGYSLRGRKSWTRLSE